jgi:aryl carrier-like protein
MNPTTLPASANFSGYPLTMTATISEGEVHLEAEFTSNRLETDWVTRAMQDMEILIGALIAASSTTKISQAYSKSSLHDSSRAGYQLHGQAVGPDKSVKSGDTHPGLSKVGIKSGDMLRRLWCEVLQLDPTDIDDNTSFLELGGDSVLAMRLAALARRAGFKLTVRQILQEPTLKDMAQAFLSPPVSPAPRVADKSEDVLRRLWSEVFQIDLQHIDDSTNFLELGGDSVLAMRLAALARKAGLQLTVRRILQKPTLAGMAQSFHGHSAPTQPPPIQNVWLDDPRIHEHILGQTKISRSDTSDIAPVTDFQAWSIASDRLASRGFSNYLILTFTQELPLQQISNAVKGIVLNNSILRTAFISYEGQLLQVVRNEPVIEHTHVRIPYDSPSRTTMHAHIKDQLQGRSALRIGHTRLITIGSSSENIAQMAISLSHAQFDAISLSELCNDLAAEFDGRPSAQRPLFADFARRVVDHQAQKKAREFWSRILEGSRLTPVAAPTVSRPHSYKYPLSKDHVRHIEAPCTNRFTFATFLKTAWALVLTQQSGRDDVVFGHLVSGRASDLGDIETAVGPCINLIPVRLNTAGRSKVSELLAEVHDQYLTAIPHETLGFTHIIRDCTSWPRQSRFSTIVQHQNVDDLPSLTLANNTVSVEVDLYCPPHDATDVWVISQPTSEGMKIALTCNEDLIPNEQANKLLDSLVGFIRLLAHDLEQPERSRQGSASSKGVAADENTVVSSTQATMMHIWQKALAPSEHSALVIPIDIPFYELRGDLAAAALLQDAYYSEFQLEVSMEELIDRPSLKEHLRIVLARRLSIAQ